MWISDQINWIISKRAKPIFFKITSNQSIYHFESNDVKFGFGVDLLNMMASAERGDLVLNAYHSTTHLAVVLPSTTLSDFMLG